MSDRSSGGLAARLLGRLVVVQPGLATVVLEPALRRQLERRNLRVALGGDHDRLRTEAAVHESRGMCVGDGVGNLDRDLDRPADVHRPPAHLRAQRLSLQELEREVHAALVLADVEQRGDVGMRQAVSPRAC